MSLSIVVAMSKGNVIGRAGGLPWRLSADLRRFRRLTTGHTIVMGRKTYESIGRPLPERRTIVVTRQVEFSAPGVETAHSLAAALEMGSSANEEVFVVGGAEIYRQALALADRLYVTHVDADVRGDTFFPAIDDADWQEMEREDHPADEKNEFAMSFVIYERRI